jgi:hypothetical protein
MRKKTIIYRWTPNGKYSAASAYHCQFQGAMTTFPAVDVWKAKSEPKCKFFTWLVLHNRALTIDNMQKKNWPCDTTCFLFFYQQETSAHLLMHCIFSKALWDIVVHHHNLPAYGALCQFQEPREWVTYLINHSSRAEKHKRLGILFFVW